MKRVLILLVGLIALVGIENVSAQSRNSYFMEGSYFRNDMNPALAPTRGYIALPAMSGLGINMSQNFLSVDNLFYQRDGQVVTAFHESVSADEFLSKLPSQGKFALDTKVNVLGLGFYAKRMFWTFGVNTNISADMAMSMDAFKALKTLGNGTYDLGDTALEANAYMDAYLGTSFRVHKNVNIGIKAKFLVGLATAEAQFNELKANVTPDAVNGVINGTFRANGMFIDNRTDEFMSADYNYILNNINNFGAALDLGVEVRLLEDHLKLSAAITDLGFIKWTTGTTNISGKLSGDFYFNGFNLETQEVDGDGSFEAKMDEVPQGGDYISRLNFSVNAGVEYNILKNHIAFGVLSHTKFCGTTTYSELTASVNFRPTNWLSATFSHTFLNHNRPGVFGFALNIHPCALNIYAGVDFVDTQWVNGPTVKGTQVPLPRYMKSMNAYVGVGFNFGRPKFLKGEKQAKIEKREKKS